MTRDELMQIVTANSVAIAENTTAIAKLTQNILLLHDSVKRLENTALAHDAQIDTLIENTNKNAEAIASLERQLQAYLNRLPPN